MVPITAKSALQLGAFRSRQPPRRIAGVDLELGLRFKESARGAKVPRRDALHISLRHLLIHVRNVCSGFSPF
jgi:hypothetical protein